VQTEPPDEHSHNGAPGQVAAGARCYHCGAVLAEGASVCPACGRRQTRWCYCGREIPVAEPTCPYCGADWSKAVRVRRRARRVGVDFRRLAGYIAAGILAAIFAAALLNSIVGALALRSLPPEQHDLPDDFSSRFGLAMQTVGRNLAVVWDRIAGLGGSFWSVLAIILVGAVGGACVYLWRVGGVRLPRLSRSKAYKRRRARG